VDFIGVDWVNDEDEGGEDGNNKKQVRLLDYACGTGVGEFGFLLVLFACLFGWSGATKLRGWDMSMTDWPVDESFALILESSC